MESGNCDPDTLLCRRSSCVEIYESQEHVKVNDEAVQQLCQQLDPSAVQHASCGHMFPVRFDSTKDEVTFLALYHLLDFGSGYDTLLLQRSKRDARETVQFGLLGIVITGHKLESPWMKAFSTFDVSNCFGIDAMEDSEVMPGVSMSKPVSAVSS